MREVDPVPLEDFLLRRAGVSTLGLTYRDKIAQPLTSVARKSGEFIIPYLPITQVASIVTGKRPQEIADLVGGPAAEFAIPQSLTGAVIEAVLPGLGKVTKGIKGIKGAATRLGALTGVGAGGGAISGEGAPMGALQGMATGITSEGISKGLDYMRGIGVDRMRQKIQNADAERWGTMFDEIFPLFRGRRTTAQLYELVMPESGRVGGMPLGRRLLGEAQEVAAGQVRAGLKTPAFPRFPDPLDLQGPLLTYDEARHRLTELYRQGYHGIKGDPLLAGLPSAEAKRLYAFGVQVFDRVLESTQPGLSRVAQTARAQYREGMTHLDLLEKGFKTHGAGWIYFNTDEIMQILSDPRHARRVAARYSDPGIKTAVGQVAFRGQPPGRVDQFSANSLLERLAERFHPAGGLTIVGRLSRPDLVGDPFRLGQGARTGIGLGSAATLEQARSFLGPEAQAIAR